MLEKMTIRGVSGRAVKAYNKRKGEEIFAQVKDELRLSLPDHVGFSWEPELHEAFYSSNRTVFIKNPSPFDEKEIEIYTLE